MVNMSYHASNVHAALPPTCPVQDGYASNPDDCSQYVVCQDYDVTETGSCTKNLYFSAERLSCVPLKLSECNSTNCKLI